MTFEEYQKKKKAAETIPKLEGPRSIEADFKDVKQFVRAEENYFAGKVSLILSYMWPVFLLSLTSILSI
jgi:hypothetical protein